MEQEQFYNRIPIPTLVIDFKTSQLTTNKWFHNEFGYNLNSIEELRTKLVSGQQFDTLPNTHFSENAILLNNDAEHISVKLTYNPHSEEETIVLVQKQELKVDGFIKKGGFNSIFGDAPFGIIISNTDTKDPIYISPYLCSKTGYSFDEIVNISWQELTYVDDIQMQEDILKESEHNQLDSFFFEKRVVSKTGKIYWFSEFIRYYNLDGQRYQTIILYDISNQKEVDAELHRAKHLAEDAEQLKTAFLDNMPHEIRTPLHAITGFTSLLSDSDLTHEERLEYVKFIQDSSNDILNLMDNIIEISKLETSQVKLKKEKCYLNSIFDKLLNDIEAKQDILEKNHLNIKVSKGNNDPLFMIISDPERIYQILSHLLNNALKFTENGEIEFGYKYPKNNQIEFFVRDTGIGIADEELDLIFKKFGKSGNINTNKNRGSGLGLTLSKKLVELLNGEIYVSTEQEVGSTFSFTITIENEQKITITKPSVTADNHWGSKTILVAEDTESNYFFIEAFLERTKVNLIWAQDGVEAIKLFKENDVNLILMDIMMPEKDGYDATREIKEINPDVPIIAQTALALPDDEEKCYLAGCDYVLVKPINSEDLIATIKRFIL
ncbi:MAG: ATP-binding protein [Prolixibacteraceae bacterium]|jgi:PAS domain S-box-containing protein|nr:ATP-binding protein [Prolixibacteraceae bacterium]